MSIALSTTLLQAPRPAKLTDDDNAIVSFAANSAAAGFRIALVTLTHVSKASARSIGAQMVVREDGVYCGLVSGGCTEAAVAAEAMLAIAIGHDRTLMLGEGSPFFDIVIPCGGALTLSIHVVREPGMFAQLKKTIARRVPAALHYDPGAQHLSLVIGSHQSGWQGGIFIRQFRPKPRLLICGRSVELAATAALAQASGYDLQCYGPQQTDLAPPSFTALTTPSSVPTLQIDADTATILLFHDLDWELPFLTRALASPAFYIGALGSRHTHQTRTNRLADLGFASGAIARIKGPIGLFGPTRDATSLAISILADVAQARMLTA